MELSGGLQETIHKNAPLNQKAQKEDLVISRLHRVRLLRGARWSIEYFPTLNEETFEISAQKQESPYVISASHKSLTANQFLVRLPSGLSVTSY